MNPSRYEHLPLFFFLLSVAALGCRGSTSEGPSTPEKSQSAEGAPAVAVAPVDPAGGQAPANESTEPGSPETAKRSPPGPPVGGVDKLSHLRGRSEAQALDELGPPTSKRELTMGECCSEFEIELYNTYPPSAGHEAVVIHQWTWAYEGYALTLWFHRADDVWTVLETSRYSDDVEF